MLAYLVFGISFGFAAAVQPGPMSALIISRALSSGWRRALPMVFAPLLGDGPVALVLLFHAARHLGPRVTRAMIGLSAAAVAGFGGYLLWIGVAR